MTGDVTTIPKQLIGKDLSAQTPERRREIASMGGKANLNNPNAKLAAKLREMKKKGLTDENSAWLFDMMTDSELAATHILKYLKKIIDDTDNPKDMNVAMKTILDWNRMKHGTNENNKKVLIGVVTLTVEEKEKEVLRLLE